MMLRLPREQWPPYHFLTTLLLFVAISELLFLCVVNVASTPGRVIKTVYVLRQNGSLDALQATTGSSRWHHQFNQQSDVSGSLLADTHVVYVGRVDETENPACIPSCQSYTGSVDALKASDGTVLWHHAIAVPNDYQQSVQVMKVIDGVVYVGVGAFFAGGDKPGGGVYALRADTGSLLWQYTVNGYCCRGLVVTKTAVYIGVFDYGAGHLDALRTNDGSLLWHHQIASPGVLLGIAVAKATVYVSRSSGVAHPKGAVEALRASDGSLIWQSPTKITPLALAAADDRVYVGGFGEAPAMEITLDALRGSNGSLIWQYKLATNEGIPLFATGMDGVVYMISGCFICYQDTIGNTLDALRASDGKLLWRYQHSPSLFWGVELSYGTVYLGVQNAGIAALQTTGGRQRWFHALHDEDGPLALTGGQSVIGEPAPIGLATRTRPLPLLFWVSHFFGKESLLA